MGFTHYAACYPIEQAAADVAFADFREDLRRLLWWAGSPSRGIRLGDAHGEGWPELSDDLIAFNGYGSEGFESFYWPRPVTACDEPGLGFAGWFCKTGQRPYDPVVVAALVLAQFHYGPAVKLSTDATPEELGPGFALLRSCWPLRVLPGPEVFA